MTDTAQQVAGAVLELITLAEEVESWPPAPFAERVAQALNSQRADFDPAIIHWLIRVLVYVADRLSDEDPTAA